MHAEDAINHRCVVAKAGDKTLPLPYHVAWKDNTTLMELLQIPACLAAYTTSH
jgi:hypothetical protein